MIKFSPQYSLPRAARALALALTAFALMGAGRAAMDFESGRVLVLEEADAPYPPASLTKMMTLYLAFEALDQGALKEGDIITVSAHAAAVPPVEIGLRKGERLSVSEAVEAAAVASANDAATALAEHIAGSEAAFVERMNAAAARLGLTRTRFINASGLPGAGQRTTARDMVMLGAALLRDHPERSRLFSQRAGRAAGRRFASTNSMLNLPGAEGIKTGFTCAAGYAGVAATRSGERRIILASLGNMGRAARLTDARALLERAKAAEPGPMMNSASPGGDLRALDACKGAPAAVRKGTRPWGTGVDAETLEIVAGADFPRAAPAAPSPPPPLGGWGVSLGAAPDEASALARARTISSGAGHPGALRRTSDGRWAAFVYGLDQASALNVQRAAAAQGGYALTLSPEALLNPAALWRK